MPSILTLLSQRDQHPRWYILSLLGLIAYQYYQLFALRSARDNLMEYVVSLEELTAQVLQGRMEEIREARERLLGGAAGGGAVLDG